MDELSRLKEIFFDLFGDDNKLDNINEQTRFIEDLGMNSIAMLSMAIAIEDEFGIKFQNEDLKKLNTVGDAIRCINSKQ